jgi:hypothetical protein
MSQRRGFWSAVASVARHRFGSFQCDLTIPALKESKAPSPLRFAGALQVLRQEIES